MKRDNTIPEEAPGLKPRPTYVFPETITLNEVFRRRKLFSEEDSLEVRTRGEQIDRKLNGLMNSLRGSRRGAE